MANLSSIPAELLEPPYPEDTKANGWKPELDIDRISASDTWTLAEDDERPWLLRIWMEAWRSVPIGSLPSDRRLIARRIGCKTSFLNAHSEILLRGWKLCSDNRLYHSFIVAQAKLMLETRYKGAKKVAEWRDKKKRQENQQHEKTGQKSVTGYIDPCNRHVTVSNRQEQEQEQEEKKKNLQKKKNGRKPPEKLLLLANVNASCARGVLIEWLEYKQASANPYKDGRGVTAASNQLARASPDDQAHMVEKAIAGNWQGLPDPPRNNNATRNGEARRAEVNRAIDEGAQRAVASLD